MLAIASQTAGTVWVDIFFKIKFFLKNSMFNIFYPALQLVNTKFRHYFKYFSCKSRLEPNSCTPIPQFFIISLHGFFIYF